ncbi:MAG: hypothetical protein K0Q95_3377 [Bacteroidota bacterium]|jgi:uncharacterized tellurite resistance protein B-like protein|nr:hypothetical protein [Bacteroidota bacterium]
MTPQENLHYAIGQLAYAIAQADGKLQPEERIKFHSIMTDEIRSNDRDFDVSDIIFHLLEKDKFVDTQTSYANAMKEIRLNSHYLSPELKTKFISILEKIANAFPPVSVEEKELINKFKKEFSTISGDPVYYGQG